MKRFTRVLTLIIIMMFGTIPVARAQVPFEFHTPYEYGVTVLGGGSGNYYGDPGSDHVGTSYYCVDFNAPDNSGYAVTATASGTVVAIGNNNYYDTYYTYDVAIEHENGYYSTYIHLRSNVVSVGDPIHQGQVIGYEGSEGKSTGSHLHFCIFNSSGNSIKPSPMDGVKLEDDSTSLSYGQMYGYSITSQNRNIPTAAYTAITAKADQLWGTRPKGGSKCENGLICHETENMHWYAGVSNPFIIEDWQDGLWGKIALTYDPDTNEDDRAYIIRHGFWEAYRNWGGPDVFGAPLGDEMDQTRLNEYTPHDPYCAWRYGDANGKSCVQEYCGDTQRFTSMQRFEHATMCWDSWNQQVCLNDGNSHRCTGSGSISSSSTNTDPYPDILVYYPTLGGWWLAKNHGSSATYAANLFQSMYTQGRDEHWYLPLIGNLNGDTYDDLIVYHQSGDWTGILNANGTLPVNMQPITSSYGGSTQYYYPYTGDFNGDGLSDALLYATWGDYYVRLSDSSTYLWTDQDWMSGCDCGAQDLPETSYQILISDLNGDGKDDVTFYGVTEGTWYGATSNGVDGFQLSTWLHGLGTQEINEDWYHPITGDINGDGRSDIGLATSGGAWYMALSTGTSFQTQTTWITTGHGSATAQFFLHDMNGDGKDDAVTFEPSTGTWRVALSTGSSFASPTTWITDFGTDSTGVYGVIGYLGYFTP